MVVSLIGAYPSSIQGRLTDTSAQTESTLLDLHQSAHLAFGQGSDQDNLTFDVDFVR